MKHRSFTGLAAILALVAGLSGCTGPSETQQPLAFQDPANGPGGREPGQIPTLRILYPIDGETVNTTFPLRVELSGIDAAPAGNTADGKGHVHILVNRDCLKTGAVIRNDPHHIHWGDGAVVKDVELDPGYYKLCVQLGDGFHAAIAVSDTIEIEVVGDGTGLNGRPR